MVGHAGESDAERLAGTVTRDAWMAVRALAPRHREIMAACSVSSPSVEEMKLLRAAAATFVGMYYALRLLLEGPPES